MAETDLTPEEAAADARLPLYNPRAYDPVTNQYGFDEDGHTINQMRQAQDVGIIGRLARRLAIFVSTQLGEAIAAKEQAQRWASNPEDAPAIPNTPFFSARHHAAKAEASAGAAADSVTAVANQAARLAGTSATSNTPSLASKTFTTQSGKAFDVGSFVMIQSRGTLNRWMSGRVTAYSGTSLTVAVEAIGSTTTAGTDWDTLAPVWEQDGVNREWSNATPSGKLEMLITNPAAADAFELGEAYYLDFTPAD